MGGCATKTSMEPSSREGEPSDNFEPAGVGQPAVELSEEELELKKKQASVTLHGTADLPPGARGGYTGLQNLGNTCFMNSALQCLSHTQPLTEYFLYSNWQKEINISNPLGMQGKIAESYGALVTRMWRGEKKILSPSKFKKTVSRWAPQFAGYEQHDSSELLTFLLDGLHEDLNRVDKKPYVEDVDCDGKAGKEELVAAESWRNYLLRNKSIIVDLFQGQLRSTLVCLHCSHRRVKFDPFMYLSLPVPSSKSGNISLDDCLREFTTEEKLTGDERWYCSKCKEFRDATKKFDLWKLPPILLVCLKRFEYTEYGSRQKIDKVVDFPVDKHWSLKKHVKSPQRESPVYSLYAVSNHHGDCSGGHYTAFCKDQNSPQWYLFNDSQYSEVSSSDDVNSSAAYVLMYQKMLTVKHGGMYRRQTVTLPQLWPHIVDGDMGGRNSQFKPRNMKLKKNHSDNV